MDHAAVKGKQGAWRRRTKSGGEGRDLANHPHKSIAIRRTRAAPARLRLSHTKSSSLGGSQAEEEATAAGISQRQPYSPQRHGRPQARHRQAYAGCDGGSQRCPSSSQAAKSFASVSRQAVPSIEKRPVYVLCIGEGDVTDQIHR
ncbi:hypothetical protein DAI22_04g055150 [Oryza sativa Japonica Group]|nr:hypothetical protein DAI22_04g055150 [Oryza sativa Japonica Group]KAF2933076.1 hypothetical protein DAI22_04g055150 [Oryza sativa Japonica Group]